MTTGEKIKEARKKAGMTQAELGTLLGVSGSMIGQWENDLLINFFYEFVFFKYNKIFKLKNKNIFCLPIERIYNFSTKI